MRKVFFGIFLIIGLVGCANKNVETQSLLIDDELIIENPEILNW